MVERPARTRAAALARACEFSRARGRLGGLQRRGKHRGATMSGSAFALIVLALLALAVVIVLLRNEHERRRDQRETHSDPLPPISQQLKELVREDVPAIAGEEATPETS